MSSIKNSPDNKPDLIKPAGIENFFNFDTLLGGIVFLAGLSLFAGSENSFEALIPCFIGIGILALFTFALIELAKINYS